MNKRTNIPKQKRFLGFSPYNALESCRLVWHNLILGRRKKKRVHYIPKHYLFNDITPLYKIGFIGDILGSDLREVNFSAQIKTFFKTCNCIVANFEGTLYDGEKKVFTDQIITEETVFALEQLAPPEKFFLSIANNHSGDFSEEIFKESTEYLEALGFNLFGFFNKPYIDINENIRLHTFSQWSNKIKGWNHISDFETFDKNISNLIKKNAINILYPHWGHELELYPRKYIIKKAREYMNYFNIIIGHHPHVPQPVSVFKNKLIAYSLGDVCYKSDKFPYHKECYGIIMKISIGNEKDSWKLHDIDWEFTRCHFDDEKELYIDTILKLPW